MKRLGFIVLLLLCVVFVFASCEEEQATQQYEIMLADKIDVYEGKQFKLRPHLMDSFGNVVESRFVYDSSSDSITVTQDGEIIINEIPSEDVYVTVTDRNTSTEKKVKIHVVRSIQSIDGITDESNKLINGLQSVIIGNDYKINVKTSLIGFEAEDYCTIKIVDPQGERVDTFGVSYDGSVISLSAIGLGKSTVEITFRNNDNKIIFNSKIDFEIKANDTALSDSILAMQEKDTVSVSELEGIKLLVLPKSVEDLSELSFLKSLDTVVFDSDIVMQCDNLSSKYTYRVKADLLDDYMDDDSWTELFANVIPYEDDYNQRYVVYRSEKDEPLSYASINEDIELKTLTFAGYTNTGWTDPLGRPVSALAMQELEKNGTHIFAVWVANENNLVFNSNTSANERVSIKATTDSSVTMPECSFTRAGYTFVGWSKLQYGQVEYLNGAEYTVEPDSEISFYAIWKANKNLLTFDANNGVGAMEAIEIKTDEIITLPQNIFVRNGYTFAGWSTSPTGEKEYDNKARFRKDSSEKVTLYAIWEANLNKLVFQSTATGESHSIEKRTDEIFDLPINTFVKAGYTFIGWGSVDGGDVEYNDQAEFKMPADKDSTLYAIWTPNLNTIIFDSNNGSRETAIQTAHTDSTVELDKNTFVYKNYKFTGWSTTPDGKVEYTDAASFNMGVNGEYTLYAVWVEHEVFEIKYELIKGVQNPSNVTEYRVDDEDIVLYPPTRDGYEFVCWCTDKELTKEITIIPSGSTGDITVIAKWKANTNTLKFDANGGEGTMEPEKICTDGSIILKDNEFVKLGYTFVGWKTSPDSSTISHYSGHEYWMGPNSEYTLYAEWKLDTYEVTYELNQGVNDTTNPTSYNVHTEAITLKDPTRKGYTFNGWYLESDFKNKIEEIATGSTGNIKLHAKWTANANTLKFDANGGTGEMDSITINTDETYELPINLFVRKGYTFIGWKSKPNENISVEYENGSTYAMGTDSEYTLYAVWSKNTYRIIYEPNGGTNNIENPLIYTVTDKIVLINPTRNGYEFVGWANAENELLENNTIAKGTVGDIVLYAKWSPKKFTISYNANGGIGSMESREAYVGESFNLAQVAFTNGKYKFAGWSTTPNGSPECSNMALYTMGAGNVTLYAVWTDTEFTIQWVLNGGENNLSNPKGYNLDMVRFDLLAPNRTGYIFDGWYTDSDFQTRITEIVCSDRKNYVLYAKWTAASYIVDLGEFGKISVTYDGTYDNLTTPYKTGHTFLGWYYNNTTLITNATKVTVASNHALSPKWQVNKYTVSFNANGGTGDTSIKTLEFGTTYGTLPSVGRTGYDFIGWYYNDSLITANTTMTFAGNHTLRAEWEAKPCGITLNPNGGSVSTTYYEVAYSDGYDRSYALFRLPTPTRTGHSFNGWHDGNGNWYSADTAITAFKNYNLIASWTPIKYTVYISPGGDGGHVKDGNGYTVVSGTQYEYGTVVTFKAYYNGDVSREWKINDVVQTNYQEATITITGDVYIYVYSTHNCIASGTMVTLADGTQKRVEDLEDDDILLVFNHETGRYEAAPILFIEDDGWKEYTLINLEFSDGTRTRIIAEHALFDVTLNKYVYITDANFGKYVGHEFVIVDEQMNRTTVTLEKSYKTREYSGCYSLITAYHSNYFIDGLLSIPGGMEGIFNFFEYGENLAYDAEQMEKDIEKYGLYTYEDFAEYVPYEVYEYMFPAKYYKVAVGKGLITFEEILELIEHYLVAHGYV